MKNHSTFGAAGVEKIGNDLIRKKNHVKTSDEIADDIRKFKAGGGIITMIPMGCSGDAWPIKSN